MLGMRLGQWADILCYPLLITVTGIDLPYRADIRRSQCLRFIAPPEPRQLDQGSRPVKLDEYYHEMRSLVE